MCARSNLKGLKRYLVHLTKNAIIIKTIFYAGILENYFSQMKREKKHIYTILNFSNKRHNSFTQKFTGEKKDLTQLFLTCIEKFVSFKAIKLGFLKYLLMV